MATVSLFPLVCTLAAVLPGHLGNLNGEVEWPFCRPSGLVRDLQ